MKNNMRTVTLKLYKPSCEKSRIIDEAMLNYTKAYQFLLDRAQPDIDEIQINYVDTFGRYTAQSIIKWINKDIDKELNRFSIEPFKDSIKLDFAGTIAEYFNKKLKGKAESYPCTYISQEEEERQYNSIIRRVYSDDICSAEAEKRLHRLMTKNERVRPLFFCRCAPNRNYSLLYDREKDRYYAKLYLLNSKSENRKKPSKIFKGKLFYIDKSMRSFSERGCRRTFLMFPLAFGKWQENFLKEAVEKPQIIKTARLIIRGGEYYLAVNIAKDRPEEIKTANYMGISRGIQDAINYSIVDKEGKFITSDAINEKDKHKAANSIVTLALETKSRVIMEKFQGGRDSLHYESREGDACLPIMSRSEYNNLANILKYKLPDKGLPDLIRVSGSSTFFSCPNCGISTRTNRFSSSIFMCTSCGTTMNIEKAGSLNLARRLIKYNSHLVKIYVEETEKGIRFLNKELDFEYYPSNPYDCAEEFSEKINETIEVFYENQRDEIKRKNYKKKLSLIKKIENNPQKNIFELISI